MKPTAPITPQGQILRQNGHAVLGSVSAAYVNTLIDVATANGANRAALLAAADINETRLADNNWRLPLSGLLAVFACAKETGAGDFIGLHMGMQAKPRTFSALGYAAMGCDTLGDAIKLIPRYESIVYDGGHTTVTTTRHDTRISWHSGIPDGNLMRPVNEAIVAGWLTLGRWITNVAANAQRVIFQHSRPTSCSEYNNFFGGPIEFDGNSNTLIFDSALLKTPLLQRDAQLRTLMETQAKEQLQHLHTTRLAPRVLTIIREQLGNSTPNLTTVATTLGLSPRSLRRHLQHENVSFGNLLTEVRHEMAKHLLSQSPLTLSEIAYQLGYAEPSSFTAAFKRWENMTPSDYRQRH